MSSEITTKVSYYERFYNTIDPELKEAVNNGFKKAEDKLDPSLFQNINVHFAADFDYLTCDTYGKKALENYYYKDFLGGIVYSIAKNEIYLQEKQMVQQPRFLGELINNAKQIMENISLHELGHVFDTYYIDVIPRLKKIHDELIYKNNILNIELSDGQKAVLAKYFNNDSYSDTDEFKKALIKDLENVENKEKLNKYMDFLYNFYYKSDRKPKETTTIEKNVEESYKGRSEVFAQLFSYALGSDDGNKEEFTDLFKNTYEVVQKYINKHSK